MDPFVLVRFRHMFIQMFYSVLLEWLFGDVSHGYYLGSGYVLFVVQRGRFCVRFLWFLRNFFSLCVHVYMVIMERLGKQGVQGCALERDFELFLIQCQWKQ